MKVKPVFYKNCRVCEQALAHNQINGLCVDCFKEMTRYKEIQYDMLKEELFKEFLNGSIK